MYQKISLIGYLGMDPEVRYTNSGVPVANFPLATNRHWIGSNGDLVNETTWFRVSVWGKQAEACEDFLVKGELVFVEGHLSPDPETGTPKVWVDNEGIPHTRYEVVATQVRFLNVKQKIDTDQVIQYGREDI